MTDFEVDAFFAIAETQSITLAADKLGITQSALSRRIMVLEESLGYPLLVHQKGVRSIQLTDFGKKFYSVAQKWKILWEEARALPYSHTTALLRISATDSINSLIMPPVYEAFSKSNPGVHLTCNTFLSSKAVAGVESGNLDIAIIARTPTYSPLIDVEQLYSEPLVLLTGKKATYESGIRPSELDPNKEVRIINTQDFESWHSYWYPDSTYPLYYMDKFTFYSDFPLMEDNWAFVPASIARQLVESGIGKAVEVRNPPPSRIVYYVIQNKPKSDELRQFISCLKETVKSFPTVTPF